MGYLSPKIFIRLNTPPVDLAVSAYYSDISSYCWEKLSVFSAKAEHNMLQ